jgi:hypothetical protein
MITLIRIEATEDGTFGRLSVPLFNGLYMPSAPDSAKLVTMEDDWRGNRRGISCIPEGDYTLVRSMFYKHGYEAFEVTEVPGRSRILIHIANTEEDVEGCIGPGLRFGPLRVHDEDVGCKYPVKNACPTQSHWVYKKAALASREAFGRFMGWLEQTDTAPFKVRWAEGVKPLEAGPV